ncbi:molecular chaperone [Serratia sp. JSRIV004]|uniref:fimbrial biogenesis chaperone n=1 Tax=Serratia sp. JSRIV004 TaxID=2831895 RepID=UPI001CBC301C|nr:molecular chaperone [Serratia sp. JSRIV004]UAN56619.1 molecular chaperone [Serratia sp. JSRIV004]
MRFTQPSLFSTTLLSLFAISNVAISASQTYSVTLNSSRVIYKESQKGGSTITVKNEHDFPILIQPTVIAEDKKASAPFAVTPPLFRLNGKQDNTLRIVYIGKTQAAEREHLYWLCVKAIPPVEEDDDNAAKNDAVSSNIQISVNNCIKLLYRPKNLGGQNQDSLAKGLDWEWREGKLQLKNTSPYYVNFSSIKIDGVIVPDVSYVAPFASAQFSLPEGAKVGGKVTWQSINDFGGQSVPADAVIR